MIVIFARLSNLCNRTLLKVFWGNLLGRSLVLIEMIWVFLICYGVKIAIILIIIIIYLSALIYLLRTCPLDYIWGHLRRISKRIRWVIRSIDSCVRDISSTVCNCVDFLLLWYVSPWRGFDIQKKLPLLSCVPVVLRHNSFFNLYWIKI